MKQSLFQFFLPQEAGGFGKNIEKEQRKLPQKWKKCEYYIFTENICSVCNPMQLIKMVYRQIRVKLMT